MGSQGGGGDNNENHSLHHPLVRQNSLYSLTLNEVQNQLGDLGKPISSMNLDELLKIVYTAEANQSTTVVDNNKGTTQASLSLTSALSRKTVDEVWKDIQGSKDNKEKCQERQSAFGDMTLEDFFVKAGVLAETSASTATVGVEPNVVTPQFSQHCPWLQYPQPQYQHPQQGLMGVYMTNQHMAQPLHIATPDGYVEAQMALSDATRHGRKRATSEEMIAKSLERRQKRMIKNRESAARSRARKQAYTIELEQKVSVLEEENEKLRKQQEVEKMLSSVTPEEPRYQIRRTASALF